MTTTTNVIAFPVRPTTTPLRRPRVLIRAAREGQANWRRERDLRRVLRADTCPPPGAALSRLRAEEERLNADRLEGLAGYDMSRHILLMIAILAEMRAIVETTPVSVPMPAMISVHGTANQARL